MLVTAPIIVFTNKLYYYYVLRNYFIVLPGCAVRAREFYIERSIHLPHPVPYSAPSNKTRPTAESTFRDCQARVKHARITRRWAKLVINSTAGNPLSLNVSPRAVSRAVSTTVAR